MRIVVKTRKADIEIDLPNGTSSFVHHMEAMLTTLEKIVEQINKLEE